MASVDDAQLVRWRAASALVTTRATDPVAAARHVLAMQAQDIRAFPLSLRARAAVGSERDVTGSLEAPPAMVRTWAMRGTLHLVAAADARWLTALLGPRFRAATVRRRRELQIPDERCESALPLIEEILADGPLPRLEIVDRLNERGFAIAAGSQAVPHLLGFAASRGVVCCGPGETFALVETWLPAHTAPADPLAELARRYLTGHAPADAGDLAAWSGLPLTQARAALAAIEGELRWWETGSGPMATLTESPPDKGDSPIARLLPRYDGYLLGWQSRDLILDAGHRRAIHPGGGVLNAALTIDGLVKGTWSSSRKGKSLSVRVAPFARLTRSELAAVEADAADIGRFADRPVELIILPSE